MIDNRKKIWYSKPNERDERYDQAMAITRRESREQAVCCLYEYEVQPEKTVAEIAEAAAEQRGQEMSPFARLLAETAVRNLEEIDGMIAASSDNWRFGRIGKVSLAILRVAVCELCFLPERTPDEIAVNEALELARLLDTDGAIPYINGVLAKVIKDRA